VPLKRKYVLVYTLICILFSLNQVIAVGAADPVIDNPIVILFDEGHGQHYNRSLYSQALADLTINKRMKVVFNTGKFNSTSFEGVDIFVSTNPGTKITLEESKYLNRFISSGKAMFLLTNPLNEDNQSLNGRGDIINEFLNYLDFGYIMGKFWSYSGDGEDFNPADIIINEFSHAGDTKYLHLKVNSSSHEILSIDKNITSIVTYSCSIEEASTPILAASSEAYSRTISGEPGGDTTQTDGRLYLMGTTGEELDSGARIVIGGSSIMFSDLIPEGRPFENSSWYNSENNSLLWLNIFDWLAEAGSETPSPSVVPEQILFFIIILIVVMASFFLLGGSLLFFIGSGRKILIVKSGEEIVAAPKSTDKAIETSSIESSPPSKESRRDRRLKQIKKHHRRRKK